METHGPWICSRFLFFLPKDLVVNLSFSHCFWATCWIDFFQSFWICFFKVVIFFTLHHGINHHFASPFGENSFGENSFGTFPSIKQANISCMVALYGGGEWYR